MTCKLQAVELHRLQQMKPALVPGLVSAHVSAFVWNSLLHTVIDLGLASVRTGNIDTGDPVSIRDYYFEFLDHVLLSVIQLPIIYFPPWQE